MATFSFKSGLWPQHNKSKLFTKVFKMQGMILLFNLAILFSSCSLTSTKENKLLTKKAKLHYDQGTNNLIDGDYTSALDNLLKANKYRPNDAKTLNNLGMAYYLKKHRGLAKKYLKEAIKNDPNHSDAKSNLASIYFDEKKYTVAEKIYQEILKDLVYQNQYRIHYNLSAIALKQGNPAKAKEELLASIAENDEYCPSHYSLGKIQLKEQLFKKAYQSFQKAARGPCYKNPDPIFYQGEALKQIGNYELAYNRFEEIINRFEKSPYTILAHTRLNELKKIFTRTKEAAFKKKLYHKDFKGKKNLLDFRNKKTKSFSTPKF